MGQHARGWPYMSAQASAMPCGAPKRVCPCSFGVVAAARLTTTSMSYRALRVPRARELNSRQRLARRTRAPDADARLAPPREAQVG